MAADRSGRVEDVELSIVLPAHNEEANIRPLWEALVASLHEITASCELIFVDDGSTDSTVEVIEGLSAEGPRIRLIRLTRNFGHQAALMAGIDAARGRVVITMDSDLQHPPQLLAPMIEAWRRGNYVVQTTRIYGPEVGWTKRLLSRLFYAAARSLGGGAIESGGADFRLLDRSVVDALRQIRDVHPFLRGTVPWLGFRTATLPFTAPARHGGAPSYRLIDSARLAFNAIFLISVVPLRLGLVLGLTSAALCLPYFAFALMSYLLGSPLPGWASMILSVLFIGSVQLIVLGLVAEYIGQIFHRVRALPAYVAYPEARTDPKTEPVASGGSSRPKTDG